MVKSGNTRTQQYPPRLFPGGCEDGGARRGCITTAPLLRIAQIKPLFFETAHYHRLDLSAHLAPAIVAPGSSVEVFAHTLGPAATVDATISWLSLSLILILLAGNGKRLDRSAAGALRQPTENLR